MSYIRNIVLLVAASIVLIACDQESDEIGLDESPPEADVGGDTGEESGVVPPAEPVANDEAEEFGEPAGDFAVIEQACRALPNASDALCSCVQDQARELSADELGLAAAQYAGDEAKSATHREKLDVMGLSRGGGFLMTAPYSC